MSNRRKSFFTRSFLTSRQLAKRWHMSAATLRQWKWFNKGPQPQKMGGRILYMREVIEEFEDALIRAHTETGERSASIPELVAEENNKNKGE